MFDAQPASRSRSLVGPAVTAGLFAIASTFAVSTTISAADLTFSWAHPRPQGNAVHDFEFVDAQNGFAVGNRGVVLRTTDSGASWSLVSDVNELGADLWAICSLANGDLIAAGSTPGLFRSTDDGASWTEVPNPSTGTLQCLQMDPSGRLDAAGEDGVVIRSTDGGLTWSSIGPGVGTIAAQYWASDVSGWVVGDNVVHHTTDAGASWTQAVAFDSFGYRDIFFSEPDRGFITADFGYWETLDGGATWTWADLFQPPLYRKETLVLDPQHWLVINSGEGAELFETTDGGESWTQLHFKNTLGFLDIVRLSNGRLLIASTCGDLFYSDDTGQTLTNATENLDQDNPGPIETMGRAPNGTLYAVNMQSSGDDETWLESHDGGLSWFRPASSPNLNHVADIHFPENDLGLVVSYEQIRRTTNAGASWSTIILPDGHRGTGFAGSEMLYLSTYRQTGGGTVFRSTDDGASWAPRGTGLASSFSPWAISFVDGNTGFVCGNNSSGNPAMYRTTNGGESWTPMSVAGIPGFIVATHWHDAQNGLVASHNWGICRTTNGGTSWTQVSTVKANDFSFRDSNYGVAANSAWNGELQRTTDGGATWETIPVPMDNVITGAILTDTGIVIGGTESRLMHALDLDPASTPSEELPSASSWTLRAYPNPTVGSTTLSWSIGAAGDRISGGDARVTLHSADGRLIRTLDVAALAAGRQETRWDGRDDAGRPVAGGVYWACWSSAGNTASERVVVVR